MPNPLLKDALLEDRPPMFSLGPYANAAERRAVTLTSGMAGRSALQSDDCTAWIVMPKVGGGYWWNRLDAGAEVVGPTGTDYAALAVSNGLTVGGYYRGDYGLSGSSGSGLASWANLAGAYSAITPHGSATNGIGAASAGLGGRAGLKQNGATQKGLYTASALAAPGTTNWHRYWVARQATAGIAGTVRKAYTESGDVYKVELATATVIYAYGAANGGTPQEVQNDVWQRGRISYTGATSGEWKLGNMAIATGGSFATSAPDPARVFGDLTLNWEWLLYMEVTGPKANFLTFATAADAAIQTTWGTIQV